MSDSLSFDGDDDLLTVSAGAFAGSGTTATYLVIAKLADDTAAYRNFFGWNDLDTIIGTNNATPAKLAVYDGAAIPLSTFDVVSTDGWCIYGFSYTGGGPSYLHKYVFDTQTWTHDLDTGNYYLNSPAVTSITFGRAGNGTNPMAATMLLAGFWDTCLSNATIETLVSGTADWEAAAAEELFRFNTMSAISSLTGTGTETARTGTSLVSDAPTNWMDGSGQTLLGISSLSGIGW